MKTSVSLALLCMVFFCGSACQAANTTIDDATTQQARQDYRAYLEQLKQLRAQYQQITTEVQKIVKEEGIPTWDDKTGQITMTHDLGAPAPVVSATPTVFGDADVRETDDSMVVKMDLPGMPKDKISIKLENQDLLKISGSREADREERKTSAGERYTSIERQQGAFERVIKLPAPAKETGTQARYENGVLTVTIPKAKVTNKAVSVPIQ